MKEGVPVAPRRLWVVTWAVWLATGALQDVPPWRAGEVLAREEREVRRLADDPGLVPFWSIDLGDTLQQQAIGTGWTANRRDAATGRGYRQTVLPAAELRFRSPGWTEAGLALTVGPLGAGQTAVVHVAVDGRNRGALAVGRSWETAHLPLGEIAAGEHRLSLGMDRSTAVAALAVGRFAAGPPPREAGFIQWVACGMYERPALFPSGGSTASGTTAVELRRRRALLTGRPAGIGASLVEALHGLAAAALLTIVTGLGLAWRVCQGPLRLGLAPLFSAAALALAFGALRLAGLAPEPLPLAIALALAGGLPLLGLSCGSAVLRWRALASGAVALTALLFFAARVVPPLDDQDLEVQATSHALATHGAPETITDRATSYFFAHPPLLHLWTAGSFALAGRLTRVEDAGRLAREARARGPFVEPGLDEYPPQHYDLWQELLARFFREPQLWPTRQVNVLLAAVSAGWLAELAAGLAGSAALGGGAALVLLTLPEFLVRGAYGGYFAATTFATLAVLAALERPGRGAGLAGALAALVNQKGLLAPAAWLLAAPRSAGRTRLLPLAGGMLGLLAFAAWGLAVDAPTFSYDFFKQHLIRRLALTDVRFASDPEIWYPSIPELWTEFADRYGLVFTLTGAGASLLALRSASPVARTSGAAVLLGALVFSLTDWRQTKHLSLLATPALLALAALRPSARPGRLTFALLLALMLGHNLVAASRLAADFEAVRPSTIW